MGFGAHGARTNRELSAEDIGRIADACHAGGLTAGIGGWFYRPPGLQLRHDRAGRWDVLARHRICVQVAILPIPASPNARHRTRWNAVYMAVLGVLIVDDSLLFVEAARDRLEREGLRVVGVAATSAEALRRAEELRPEIVLVDVMLGGESGFELARRLAAHHRDGGPAVILISTYSAADFARPIAESPAAGFLPKQELSAYAIRRIIDGREPGDPPGVPAR